MLGCLGEVADGGEVGGGLRAGWGTGGPVWRTHPDWVCEIAVGYAVI